MEEQQRSNNAGDGAEPIRPAEFTPPPPPGRGWRPRLRPLYLLLAVPVLLAAAAFWFVLTARSVHLELEPATAQVEIDGGLAVPVGERYLMRPGEYQLQLQGEGYFDLSASLSVGEEAAQTHSFALQPRPGLIDVLALGPDGEPLPGTRVSLDDVDMGTTPLEDVEVEPGEYQLSLQRERYLPWRETLNVEGRLVEQEVEAELRPAWADVTLRSRPEGAEVLVDGEARGRTPMTAELLQGRNAVTVKLEGYKAWQEDLRVTAGEDRTLETIELEPADGLVFIRSEPSGANVTVDDEFRGQTPLEVALEPDRDHTISLNRNGYQSVRRQLRTAPDEERELSVTLEPVTAPVRVVADPPDAELYVDGELRGEADQTVELMTAEQRIEIRKSGYVPYTTTFTARPGLDQQIRVTLQTEEQARREAIEPTISTGAGQTLDLFRAHAYTMGASRREAGRRANEAMRDVNLERPFYLARHPVTNAEYREFREDHLSGSVQEQTLDRPGQPVVSVSWQDAALYCNWLSEQESLPPFYRVEDGEVIGFNPESTGYRLPSEAEWEWAARSDGEGGIQRFTWGEEWPPPEGAGNFADESTSEFLGQYLRGYDDGVMLTSNVGEFPANPQGLYDMAGNVSEWVHDFYGAVSGLSTRTEVDPMGPESGSYHTIKGSSWRHGTITELRLSYRDFGDEPRDDLGFRVARYLEEIE